MPLPARRRAAEIVGLAALCAGVALAGALLFASVDLARAQDGGAGGGQAEEGGVEGQGDPTPTPTATATPTPTPTPPAVICEKVSESLGCVKGQRESVLLRSSWTYGAPKYSGYRRLR